MHISVRWSALKETRWNEYAVRFLFGGLATALAGYVAYRFGPVVGGLFLAFPAIFPASATLVDKHEEREKQEHGLDGRHRGCEAAGVTAAGAALGSLGLMGFAVVIWRAAAHLAIVPLLALAMAVWATISFLLWVIRQKI